MEKAISMKDSSFNYLGKIGEMQFKAKNYAKAANAYQRSIEASSKPSPNDYFYYANAVYMQASRVSKDSTSYAAAVKAWGKVAEIFGDSSPNAFYYQAISTRSIEGQNPKGGALPYYESFIKAASKDAVKNKKNLIDTYNYLGNYNLLITKDTMKATGYYNETLKLDAANADATQGLASLAAPTSVPVVVPAPKK
jgi:tetratricopeptide (TPR) repeat protein